MEHRYDKRFPTDLKTLIFKNGMPVALGCVRNFSRGGIFVTTECGALDVNQTLELELAGRGDDHARGCGDRRLCKTLVMHKADGGVGLLIREDCVETQANYAAFVAEELSRAHQENAVAAAPTYRESPASKNTRT